MKRILVTGSNGFIGSHLVAALLASGKEVLGLDVQAEISMLSNSKIKKNSNFTYYKVDIKSDREILDHLISKVDAVVHLAAIVGVEHYIREPAAVFETNVIGSWNIIKACTYFGKRIVFGSTSEVFGKNLNVPWSETSDRVLGPTSVDRWGYSTSKSAVEHLLFGLGSQLDFRIVRFFNAYGPGQSPKFLVSANIYNALRHGYLEVYDSGKQTRCLTYIDDIVNGLLLVTLGEVPGNDFNLGNDEEISVAEIVKQISALTKVNEIRPIDTSAKFGENYEDLERRVPATAKAQSLLGWSAKISSQVGITQTIQWSRQNTWWWK
jgi:nucleoside-diphosphate-sugar epimerase